MAIPVISTVALSIIVLAGSTVQAQMTEEARRTVLDQHNAARRTLRAANMLELEYDSKLECVARKYIESSSSGSFPGHNPHSGDDYRQCGGNKKDSVGENWFSGPPEEAVWAFIDAKWPWNSKNGCSEREKWIANLEGQDIKAATNHTQLVYALKYCKERYTFGDWGHYTQVMWAETAKVGCWYTKKFGTLCNYSPAGNVFGSRGKMLPYVIYGEPCTKCPDSAPNCKDGLCSNCK